MVAGAPHRVQVALTISGPVNQGWLHTTLKFCMGFPLCRKALSWHPERPGRAP